LQNTLKGNVELVYRVNSKLPIQISKLQITRIIWLQTREV